MDGAHRPGPFASGLAWAVAIYLVLPISVILPVSLTDQRFLSLPRDGLSLRHFGTVLTSPDWIASIGQSFGIAVASTLIAVVAGTSAPSGAGHLRRSTELVRAMMLPSHHHPIDRLRHRALPLLRPARPAGQLPWRDAGARGDGHPLRRHHRLHRARAFDARLEQAARGMGASLGQTLRWVILPRIAPGIVSGAIFAFIHSWDELVILLFIASREVFTLPRRIWDGINENLDPAMAAVAVLLVLFTVLLLIFDLALRGRRDG
jgi:putative spermidine/putrescine transport system permease protein